MPITNVYTTERPTLPPHVGLYDPVEEMMGGLDELVRAGKILYYEFSDTPAYVIAKANMYAQWRGRSLAQVIINWVRQQQRKAQIIPILLGVRTEA